LRLKDAIRDLIGGTTPINRAQMVANRHRKQ
jgi:hypothetical protein